MGLCVSVCAAATTPKELLAAGRVDEAIQTLQQRIDHSPNDAESYNLLCRAYFMLEEWDWGISACERAVSLEPNNSLYHLWLARIYGEKADRSGFWSAAGMVKRVRSQFERAVELNLESWEARTDLAEFYMEAPGIVGGGKDKARAQADVLDKLNPAMAHWVRGRIAEKSNDTATAEREYRAEIEASQGSARGWLDLALFYRHEKRFAEMEQALGTMESRPAFDRPDSVMDGANVLLRTGRNFPLAVRLAKRYLSLATVEEGPTFKAHCILGELLEKQGERKDAAKEFRAALALAREYKRAQEGLNRVER